MLDRGEGLWLIANDWGSALRYNGLGRYDEALDAAERAADDPRRLGLSIWLASELIEAAVRSGKPKRAESPLASLAAIAEAAGTDWARANFACSAALVADGAAAERLYQEAIERLHRIRTRGCQTLARVLRPTGGSP